MWWLLQGGWRRAPALPLKPDHPLKVGLKNRGNVARSAAGSARLNEWKSRAARRKCAAGGAATASLFRNKTLKL